MKWMKQIKKYLLIMIIIVLLTVLLWGGRRREEEETVSKFRYQADKPRVVSYYQGEKRWDLAAESILEPKSDQEEEKIILLNIKDGKLYRGNELEYELDADKIIYFTDSEDVELTGNVKLKEVEGKEILTSKLNWSAKEDKLTTNSGVKVKLEDGKLSSKEMEIDVENKTIDFIGEVEMTFEIKGVESNEE